MKTKTKKKTIRDPVIPSRPIVTVQMGYASKKNPPDILGMLRDLEWVGGVWGLACQLCGWNHDYGHDPRCPFVVVFPDTKVFKPGPDWDRRWNGLERYRPAKARRQRPKTRLSTPRQRQP